MAEQPRNRDELRDLKSIHSKKECELFLELKSNAIKELFSWGKYEELLKIGEPYRENLSPMIKKKMDIAKKRLGQ